MREQIHIYDGMMLDLEKDATVTLLSLSFNYNVVCDNKTQLGETTYGYTIIVADKISSTVFLLSICCDYFL